MAACEILRRRRDVALAPESPPPPPAAATAATAAAAATAATAARHLDARIQLLHFVAKLLAGVLLRAAPSAGCRRTAPRRFLPLSEFVVAEAQLDHRGHDAVLRSAWAA